MDRFHFFSRSEKWKIKSLHFFSRSESEIETARDREREVKEKKNSREFSRNENLAGLWQAVRDWNWHMANGGRKLIFGTQYLAPGTRNLPTYLD